MAKALSLFVVTFDDGTEITVETRPKDLARAEMGGWDFEKKGRPVSSMYAVAWAALGRMERSGVLPEGVVVPESIDAFMDTCDVTTEDDDEGEGGGQGLTSG